MTTITRREWLKTVAGFGIAVKNAGRLPLVGAAEPAQTRQGRTILLVDDHDVLYRSGTERVLHPATRHPANPLILQDKPWEVAIG